ncbi:MAG: indole-3-glycerol phosphate synthase TrpC [Deltaproteobacteria bacterium]|nr:indole-3-glycerol phosphate synthase TrpC [Deltaproteobacteria bacterium]
MLEKILKYKKEELESTMRRVRLPDVKAKAEDAEPARDFHGDLESLAQQIKIIAEIKKASPSGGVILQKYDPVGIAMQYEENGAAAISVLTDEHFFQGSLKHLSNVHEAVKLPLLRKDFTFHEYQIYEARGALADAILLIARILDDFQLKDYLQLAGDLGMAALVEVHDEKDLERALKAKAAVIGINNRDLETLKTDLAVTERLAPKVGAYRDTPLLVISESGISERKDIERLNKVGVRVFLIGEALLREKNPGEKLRELL